MKYPTPYTYADWRAFKDETPLGYIAYRLGHLRRRFALWTFFRIFGADSVWIYNHADNCCFSKRNPEWPAVAFNVKAKAIEPQTEPEDLTEPKGLVLKDVEFRNVHMMFGVPNKPTYLATWPEPR